MKKFKLRPPQVFKSLITEEEYQKINLELFSLKDPKHSFCTYFDTSLCNPNLFRLRIRLRVKIYKDQITIELKLKGMDVPSPKEIYQPITITVYQDLITNGLLPDGPVKERLALLGLNEKFIPFGKTETFSKKIKYKEGLLIIDHSIYAENKIEYQIEFRSNEFNTEDTLKILHHIGLPYRIREGKLKNIFKALNTKTVSS